MQKIVSVLIAIVLMLSSCTKRTEVFHKPDSPNLSGSPKTPATPAEVEPVDTWFTTENFYKGTIALLSVAVVCLAYKSYSDRKQLEDVSDELRDEKLARQQEKLNLDWRFRNLFQGISSLRTRIVNAELKTANQQTEIDKINTDVPKAINAINNKVGAVEQNLLPLVNVPADIVQINQQLADQQKHLDDEHKAFETQRQLVASHHQSIGDLENARVVQKQATDTLKTRVGNAHVAINDINSKIKELPAISETVGEHSDHLNDLETRFQSAASESVGSSHRISQTENSIAIQNEIITGTQGRVKKLENKIAEVPTKNEVPTKAEFEATTSKITTQLKEHDGVMSVFSERQDAFNEGQQNMHSTFQLALVQIEKDYRSQDNRIREELTETIHQSSEQNTKHIQINDSKVQVVKELNHETMVKVGEVKKSVDGLSDAMAETRSELHNVSEYLVKKATYNPFVQYEKEGFGIQKPKTTGSTVDFPEEGFSLLNQEEPKEMLQLTFDPQAPELHSTETQITPLPKQMTMSYNDPTEIFVVHNPLEISEPHNTHDITVQFMPGEKVEPKKKSLFKPIAKVRKAASATSSLPLTSPIPTFSKRALSETKLFDLANETPAEMPEIPQLPQIEDSEKNDFTQDQEYW
jgi:predicted  nucleic acid-binding Zn-ribbon protein